MVPGYPASPAPSLPCPPSSPALPHRPPHNFLFACLFEQAFPIVSTFSCRITAPRCLSERSHRVVMSIRRPPAVLEGTHPSPPCRPICTVKKSPMANKSLPFPPSYTPSNRVFVPRSFEARAPNAKITKRRPISRCSHLTPVSQGQITNKALVRQLLLKRDGRCCSICHRILKEGDVTIDHHIARSCGGSNVLHNLRLACKACNSGRHSDDHFTLINLEDTPVVNLAASTSLDDVDGEEFIAPPGPMSVPQAEMAPLSGMSRPRRRERSTLAQSARPVSRRSLVRSVSVSPSKSNMVCAKTENGRVASRNGRLNSGAKAAAGAPGPAALECSLQQPTTHTPQVFPVNPDDFPFHFPPLPKPALSGSMPPRPRQQPAHGALLQPRQPLLRPRQLLPSTDISPSPSVSFGDSASAPFPLPRSARRSSRFGPLRSQRRRNEGPFKAVPVPNVVTASHLPNVFVAPPAQNPAVATPIVVTAPLPIVNVPPVVPGASITAAAPQPAIPSPTERSPISRPIGRPLFAPVDQMPGSTPSTGGTRFTPQPHLDRWASAVVGNASPSKFYEDRLPSKIPVSPPPSPPSSIIVVDGDDVIELD